MTSSAGADSTAPTTDTKTHATHENESMKSSPQLTAAGKGNENHDEPTTKDDAATMAASEELKHTTISDKKSGSQLESADIRADGDDDKVGKIGTPESLEATDEAMRERISSPKKKRVREFDDEGRDPELSEFDDTSSSLEGNANGRTSRSEPEKKRPRDKSADPLKASEEVSENQAPAAESVSKPLSTDAYTSTSTSTRVFGSDTTNAQTKPSAFAKSGFASLASSSTSPFGSIAGSKPSVFAAGNTSSISGFGALAGAKAPGPTTASSTGLGASQGSGFGFAGGSGVSGFGALGTGSAFGSALGGSFAGGSGPKLSSFATPAKPLEVGAKPAKPFGAPDSDEDEGTDANESGDDAPSDEETGVKLSAEDKKKTKTVKVEDGEAGEATLLQIRAKIFVLNSTEAGWKERGVGTLKVNAPKSCVEFDDNNNPIPGSFDISGLEDSDTDGPQVPRLIMRQENTHRVILNTVIVPAMKFQDKPSTSAAQIVFIAFEAEKPINMLLRMNESNAKAFKSEIASIQHELKA